MSDTSTRRDYLKWVIGGAVGVPVAVESGTFLAMIRARLTGESAGVGVGDELFPGTTATETVTELAVVRSGGSARLELTVEVTASERPFGVAVTGVELDDGTQISERAATGRVPEGETGVLRGAWRLPPGSTPTALDAVGYRYADGERTVAVAERVDLSPDVGAGGGRSTRVRGR